MKINSRIFFATVVLCLVCFLSIKTYVVSASEAAYAVVENGFTQQTGQLKSGTETFSDSANSKAILQPSAGEIDTTFNAVVDTSPGNARAAVVQTDGKVIVGGFFKTLNGAARRGIVRLNVDNSIDATFSTSVNGTIFALALAPNGKIIVVGEFSAVNGVSRNRIAQLNADGSLDASFNPGNGADNTIYDVVFQPDGKILLGGSFYGINSTASSQIARLNADGSPDASFKSPFSTPLTPTAASNAIFSVALQSNGKIVVGGTPGFTSSTGGSTFIITSIARLNADGSLDSTFKAASINSTVEKVVIQPGDDKILIGGSFTSINGVSRRFVARLNADGSLDASFNPGTGGNLPVHSIFLKPDGKILIGGDFSTFNNAARNRIAQLNADGSLDAAFVPPTGIIGSVRSVVALSSGKVFAVGSFVLISGKNSDSIAVLNADGSIDASAAFTTTATGGVRAIAKQAGGEIIIGGNFNRVNGSPRLNIARFSADGALLGTASPLVITSSPGQVNSIVVLPDGKFLVGGFNVLVPITSNGTTSIVSGSLFRFNADGTLDSSFTASGFPVNRGVNALAVQPDGKIIVVARPSSSATGGIVRLNADGSSDSSFSVSIPQAVLNSVVIQPDGKILVGGQFSFGFVDSRTGSIFYNGVVRLNADGSRDTTFTPATITDSTKFTNVYALALQTDGKILIGGSIFTAGRTTPTGAARLNADGSLDATFDAGAISGTSDADIARVEAVLPLPNGKILIGGSFNRIGAAARGNIARLNADGSLDNSFTAAADAAVYDLARQADGKILIGGDFETVNGVARTSVARLLDEQPTTRRALFDYDGDGKSDVSVYRPSEGNWYISNSGSGGALSVTRFGLAEDRIVPADYDGDGKTDVAIYRPNEGNWYLLRSSAGFGGVHFGNPEDVPVAADFNGDGKSELVAYRPSEGIWYVFNLVDSTFTGVQFGNATDKPVPADFDGDGKADYAIYRASEGNWYLQQSTAGFNVIRFGLAGDKPIAADFDGDNKADFAIYRPSDGDWYVQRSKEGFGGVHLGAGADIPVAADFDGDGKTDIAIYRPSEGAWYQLNTTTGFQVVNFGIATDKPTPFAFVP